MDDAWRAEDDRLRRAVVAAEAKVGLMLDAPDTEVLDADQFEAVLSERNRLEAEFLRHRRDRIKRGG